MADYYSGKTVWVTGASSGIGAAIAAHVAARGANVILSARRADRLAECAERCGPNATVLPLDLNQPETHAEATKRAEASFGGVDILVNNGGVSQRSHATDTSLEVTRSIMETNFFGQVSLTQCVLPSMLQRRSGRIVVVSSVTGRVGVKLRSSYAASKHALHGYFDALRAEIAATGVGVTLITPGFVRTEISENAFAAGGGRYGTVDSKIAGGISPERCAERIAAAVEKGRNEVAVGGREIHAITMKRFFPNLTAHFVSKYRIDDQ